MKFGFRFQLFLFTLIMSFSGINAQDILFHREIGGTGDDGIYDLVTDNSGNIVVLGWYTGIVDLDPGPSVVNTSSYGDRDIFVAKFDSAGNYLWSISCGSGLQDEGSVLTVDSSGNVIIAGRFESSVDFLPGPGANILTSHGDRDVYICKYSSIGQLIWAKSFGGLNYDDAEDVEVDSSGNIYLAGSFQKTVDFDPSSLGIYSLVSVGGDDGYLLKLDYLGDFQWVKTIGGISTDEMSVLKVVNNEFLYIGGSFSDSCEFNTGLTFNTFAGSNDAYIAKFDTSGAFQWVKTFGGSGSDAVYGMDFGSNSMYVTGTFSFSADFDPSNMQSLLTSIGLRDAFFAKYDTAGSFIWVRKLGSLDQDLGLGVSCLNDSVILFNQLFSGNAFVIGNQNSMVLSSAGNYDIANCFFSDNGEFRSAFTLSTIGVENIHSSYAINSTDFFLNGLFGGAIDFDPDPGAYSVGTLNGVTDAFFSKYKFECDSDFNAFNLTQTRYGCQLDTIILKVSNASHASFVDWFLPAGWASLSADGDSVVILPNSLTGIVSCRLRNNCFVSDTVSKVITNNFIVADTLIIPLCYGETYVFPDSSIAYSDTTVSIVYTIANGCDSIVPMQIDFLNSNTINDSVLICINGSYTIGSNTYYSAGVYVDTLSSFLGCDSIVTTVLGFFPFNDFIVQAFICDGDSVIVNNHVYTIDGVYVDTLLNVNGCDSILTTHVTVLPVFTVNNNVSICQGEVYNIGNSTYSLAGTYTDTLQSSLGCDSLVLTDLIVNPYAVNLQTITMCYGDSAIVGNSIYFNSGLFSDTLQTTNGCDSLIVTSLIVDSIDVTILNTGNVLFAQQGGATYQWYQCDSSGIVELIGANAQFLNVSTPGYYGVEINYNACSDSSVCIYSGPLTGESEQGNSELVILKDPTNDYFEIGGRYSKLVYEMFDLKGRLLKSGSLHQFEKVDIQDFPTGVYVIRLFENNQTSIFKVVVY